MPRARCGTVAAIVLGSIAGTCEAQTHFIGLGQPPGAPAALSDVVAVSGDGTTVLAMFGNYPYRWSLDTGWSALGSVPARARAISADGSVVGGDQTPQFSTYFFRWTAQTGYVTIDGGVCGGMSGDGSTLVGSVHTGQWGSLTLWTAFKWSSGTGRVLLGLEGTDPRPIAIAASFDGAAVVGTAKHQSLVVRALRWTATGHEDMGDLPGGITWASAAAISLDGSAATGTSESAEGLQGFRWTAPTGMVGLGVNPAGNFLSNPRAISGNGSVIVGDTNTGWASRAMIWDQQHGVRDLKRVLTDVHGLNLTGWTLTYAAGVSADGTVVVGHGENPCNVLEAWMARIGPTNCYANCDQSTNSPALNVADFACFLARYAAGSHYANCDLSCFPPALNVADFSCFLHRYAEGCE